MTGGQIETSRTALSDLPSTRSQAHSENDAALAMNGLGNSLRHRERTGLSDTIRMIAEFRHIYEQCGANIVNEAIRVRYIQVCRAC